MNLVHEFTFTGFLKPPVPVGQGPIGTRMYYEVAEGKIEGERLRGRLLGGGEWALIGPDGFLRVDVRLQAETGAFLYIQYTGLLEMNAAVQKALATGLRRSALLHKSAARDRRHALCMVEHDFCRR